MLLEVFLNTFFVVLAALFFNKEKKKKKQDFARDTRDNTLIRKLKPSHGLQKNITIKLIVFIVRPWKVSIFLVASGMIWLYS